MTNFSEIDTEPMLTAAARFAADVADLEVIVRSCLATIGELHGWENGDDGRAFGEIYNPWAEEVTSSIDALLLRFGDTGTNTGMAAMRAEAADEDSATELNSVGEEA